MITIFDTTTLFTAFNKVESFKKKLKLWLHIISGETFEIFQAYLDYIMEQADFFSHSSITNILSAHLDILMLSFEKHYPEHEDTWKQNMWIINPFFEYEGKAYPTKKP